MFFADWTAKSIIPDELLLFRFSPVKTSFNFELNEFIAGPIILQNKMSCNWIIGKNVCTSMFVCNIDLFDWVNWFCFAVAVWRTNQRTPCRAKPLRDRITSCIYSIFHSIQSYIEFRMHFKSALKIEINWIGVAVKAKRVGRPVHFRIKWNFLILKSRSYNISFCGNSSSSHTALSNSVEFYWICLCVCVCVCAMRVKLARKYRWQTYGEFYCALPALRIQNLLKLFIYPMSWYSGSSDCYANSTGCGVAILFLQLQLICVDWTVNRDIIVHWKCRSSLLCSMRCIIYI